MSNRRINLCIRSPFCFCSLSSCCSKRCFHPSFCSVCCFRFHFFFVVLFIAAAAVFAFFFSFSQTQWHVSVNVVVFESSSSSSFQVFVFSCVVVVVLFSLMHVGKSPSTFFELLPADSFTCASVASLVSLCCRVYLTTRSLPFIPASLSRLPTAHSRCDEFFDCHFSICPSTSVSMSWYLMYFRFPLWHVFATICPFTDTCFSAQFVVIESRGTSCFT